MNRIEFNYHLKKLNYSDKSLELIYNYYFGRIVIYICREYEGGSNISQDVAQEFFRYLYNLKNKPYVDAPTAWVYKCCDHIALKMLKIEREYNLLDENAVAADLIIEDNLYGDLEEYIPKFFEGKRINDKYGYSSDNQTNGICSFGTKKIQFSY